MKSVAPTSFFQIANASADRRLFNLQHFGRSTEASAFVDRKQITQVTNFDRHRIAAPPTDLYKATRARASRSRTSALFSSA